MLQKLVIRNYAIIDHLTIEPDTHLNIVTGETGAGKSIILGALSLILGERADTSVLINKEEKSVVEAYFDVANNEPFRATLRAEDIEEDAQCIIRREISASGKSRAFVNDTPVTLGVLNKLTSLLVDLHQQFGHLALEDDRFQLDVIDAIARAGDQRKIYQSAFREYTKISEQLADLQLRQLQWQKESDYKQFLFDELAQASFKEHEIEDAEQQLKQLMHAERIITVLQTGRTVLEEGEQPLANEIRRMAQQLQSISDVTDDVKPLQERLLSVYAELKDISSELEALEGRISIDPATMQQLQERIDIGYRLCKKHSVRTTGELIALQHKLEEELRATLHLGEEIDKLTKDKEVACNAVLKEAAVLTELRKNAAPSFARRVNEQLRLVGMPNAQFEVDIRSRKAPEADGMDMVRFLLDANRSGQLLPVYKSASGGEMSRIMLCIKALTAQAMHLPTLIFDEVDTGISGEAARQVGMLLHTLGRHHQIICITHQPQVAAKGAKHFFVYKEFDAAERITTRIRVLKPEERIMTIAQMIGGEKPSEAAVQNARELVLT